MGKYKTVEHPHLHTDISNSGNYFEVVTTTEQYIKAAVESGAKTFCVTEHGNVINWFQKKLMAEAAGLKYVHGIEAYVTYDLNEKVRDNHHLVLIAKNKKGVEEINKLSSTSFNRKDGHFYYNPRMTFEEIKNTSDNIFILTACLGSPFYQYLKSKDVSKLKEWMAFVEENKHRVFLEVQPHHHEEQKTYNKFLLKWSEKANLNIIASNDVHTLDEESEELRQIMKKAKKSQYLEEDAFELWYKSREAMEESFRSQGVLTEEQIQTSIDNTVELLFENIEEFELDYTFKFPQMHEDPIGRIKELIVEGYKTRGILARSDKEQKIYKERVIKELQVFIKTGSINYMLLEYEVKKWASEREIYAGYGRGSAGGSLISYLLHVTELDSVRLGLDFERFMNIHRVSLPDIDSDWFGLDRYKVQEYLLTHKELDCASIVTLGTFGVKGAIDMVAKGLENSQGQLIYSLSDIEDIKRQLIIEGNDVFIPDYLKEENKELFKHVESLFGVVSGVGRHAAGVVVATRDLDAEMGTMTISNWDFKVTQLNMKAIDKLNWVKLDVLAIDSLELVNRTAKFAGIERPTPDSTHINYEDKEVWASAQADNTTLFQFTETRAGKILSDMLSKATLDNIRKQNPNFKYVDLIALASAAQRPSGESYVENVQNGIYKDNGHPALNALFEETMGYMVYQEQQSKFLVEMCGWTMAEADVIRRGIGKKDHKIMDEEVPKIKPSFIKTMVEEHGDTLEHAEEIADAFIQIFMDAVNYGFNKSHAVGYAYITAAQAWLRHYYPLEYCTVALDLYNKDQEKTKLVLDYAEKHDIKISNAKFRYSRGDYFFNKETNTIYQGTVPIKGNSGDTGEILYSIKDQEFNTFTDLLLHIKDGTKLIVDKKEVSLQEVYSMELEDLKEFDKKIANAIKYNDFDPYEDKTVRKRFNTFMNKLDPLDDMAIRMADITLDVENTESGMRALFDEWLENYDKGKQPWKDELLEVKLEGSSLPINKTKMLTLINLDFFEEFGNSKKLAKVYEMFNEMYKPKNKKYEGKAEVYNKVKHFENTSKIEDYTIIEKIEFQNELLGRITLSSDKVSSKYSYVADVINIGKTRTTALIYIINKGVYQEIKIGSKLYRNVPIEIGDLVAINEYQAKPKIHKIQGEYVKSETEKDLWITSMKFIRRKPKGE